MFRSFFIAVHGSTELEFKPSSLFGSNHFMQGKFKSFDFKIRELKVFKGQGREEEEVFAEE